MVFFFKTIKFNEGKNIIKNCHFIKCYIRAQLDPSVYNHDTYVTNSIILIIYINNNINNSIILLINYVGILFLQCYWYSVLF